MKLNNTNVEKNEEIQKEKNKINNENLECSIIEDFKSALDLDEPDKKVIYKKPRTKSQNNLDLNKSLFESKNNESVNDEEKKFNSKGIIAKFFAKKNENYKEIFNKWKKIKSIELDEDCVKKTLNDDELIFEKCQQLAIDKLKNLKSDNIDEILNILSYDNINPSILYFCFQKLKKYRNIDDLISEYKYCFCGIRNISFL